MSYSDLIKQYHLVISYPRTGYHWLGGSMELYFNKPSLPDPIYIKNSTDYWWLHQHDIDEDIIDQNLLKNKKDIIYLYRNSCDTLFSHLMYILYRKHKTLHIYENDINFNIYKSIIDKEYYSYKSHLQRWFNNDNVFLYIRYEEFKSDPYTVFKNICEFFEKEYKPDLVKKIITENSKEKLMNEGDIKSPVMNEGLLKSKYSELRESFKDYFNNNYKELAAWR